MQFIFIMGITSAHGSIPSIPKSYQLVTASWCFLKLKEIAAEVSFFLRKKTQVSVSVTNILEV